MIYALDFSRWKRKPLQQIFSNQTIRFVSDINDVPSGSELLVWGMRVVPEAKKRHIALIRVEDGFLRSVGLGTDLIKPLSWVTDRSGIYFDATRESDLERLLTHTSFSPELLERAKKLRTKIVTSGLTKYNTGSHNWIRPAMDKKIILVPGQVESDASISYGSASIKTNIDLLQKVREANPEAYILYKPHPDVVARMRAKGQREDEVTQWCDEVIIDAPMGQLLESIDEVHCLTSLAGFEALLRDKKVTCYGHPFYAGWGLTNDVFQMSRRSKILMLDELVAGALILYPHYMSRTKESLISPEEAIDELIEWQLTSKKHLPWWRKTFRILLRIIVGVR